MARPDICILLNPKSGHNNGAPPRAELERALADAGLTAEIREARKGSELPGLARQAVADGFGTNVAGGGDGTMAAVAGQLAGTGRTMGILPLGTFNYFARSLEIPETLDEAVALLRDGTPRAIRTATINGEVFLNNASLGAYPAILRNRELIYARWGRSRIAAYWSVLRTLIALRRPMQVTLRTNGTERSFKTPLVFAINNVFQLEQIGLQGAEAVEAGKLAVYVAPGKGRWAMLKSALALLLRRAKRHVDFELIAGTDLRIDCPRRRIIVARDGERARMATPLHLAVQPGNLRVIAPDEAADRVR